jgi:hypothetical protein
MVVGDLGGVFLFQLAGFQTVCQGVDGLCIEFHGVPLRVSLAINAGPTVLKF